MIIEIKKAAKSDYQKSSVYSISKTEKSLVKSQQNDHNKQGISSKEDQSYFTETSQEELKELESNSSITLMPIEDPSNIPSNRNKRQTESQNRNQEENAKRIAEGCQEKDLKESLDFVHPIEYVKITEECDSEKISLRKDGDYSESVYESKEETKEYDKVKQDINIEKSIKLPEISIYSHNFKGKHDYFIKDIEDNKLISSNYSVIPKNIIKVNEKQEEAKEKLVIVIIPFDFIFNI